MKTAPLQKRTETALWARRIFSARMSAKTAGREIAKGFRRFAKQVRVAASGQMSEISDQAKKSAIRSQKSEVSGHPTSDLRSLISEARLRFYAVALRFKRSPITDNRSPITEKSFSIFHRTKRTATGNVFLKGVESCP